MFTTASTNEFQVATFRLSPRVTQPFISVTYREYAPSLKVRVPRVFILNLAT